jgi:hypothetical protein
MFASRIAAQPYADPWNQPLTARLAQLARGRRRVAYYYEEANNSTFRYRAYNMAQVLNSQPGVRYSASYFFQADLHAVSEIADQADVLVICRSGYNHRINQLITQFRNRGKPVYFDIDDFVFNTDYTHLVVNTLGLDKEDPRVWDDWFGMMSRMGQTLKMCDGAITTNSYLAQRIAEFSRLPVHVVPNFMNQEQIALSERLFAEKEASGFARDDSVCLGYFSGSPSHRFDFALVESALERVLEANPQTRLMVVGYIEAGPNLQRFGPRISYQPFQDYVNLQRLVAKVEFNLMPLQSNVFTNCKSELKYFESAVVGTLSIASPAVNYASAISDGDNGYIARAHQWVDALQTAIQRMNQYPEMARRAQADAHGKYAWQHQAPKILTALGWD